MEKHSCEQGHESFSASAETPCPQCHPPETVASGAVIQSDGFVMSMNAGEITFVMGDGSKRIYRLDMVEAAKAEAERRGEALSLDSFRKLPEEMVIVSEPGGEPLEIVSTAEADDGEAL